MYTPSTFHMRESYIIKYQSHYPDTPTYMEAVSGENAEEHIFKGSQLLITMFFQENGISSARGNLIGQSGNSRHDIVREGVSRRDCLLNPLTLILQWYNGPQGG